MLYGYRQLHFHVKKEDIYNDIGEHVETKFGTSSYETDIPLPTGKMKK